MGKVLRCYAEGRGNQWEAICLDLDIAVQGETLAEAVDALHKAIEMYVEYVNALPAEDRRQFVRRSAPSSLWFKFLWHVLRNFWRRRDDGNGKTRLEILLPCPA